MNRCLSFTLAAALLCGAQSFSAETNSTGAASPAPTTAAPDALETDLKDLVTRINAKLQAEKNTEADLADNLKEFDALVAKYKDAKVDERAQVLALKAELYMQVLDKPEEALKIFKQIKSDFPDSQINDRTDQVVAMLDRMIESKKIREALKPGSPFPDFDEKDVEGNPLSISKYKGKVVLVDFWATWCVPCIVQLPAIQKAYEKFHDRGFEVVGISLDVEKEKLQEFVKQKKMPWPEFYDGKQWENKLAMKYGVNSTPTGYLIDQDGKIIMRVQNPDTLEPAITKALGK